MGMFRFNSISKKFLVPTLFLTVILLFGLGLFMTLKNNASIKSMINSKGNALSDFMVKISINSYNNFDFISLDEFVKEITRDPEVEFAVFYDKQKQPITKKTKEVKDASSLIVFEREIKDSNSNLLGYLKIGYNHSALSRNFRSNIIALFINILIAIILLTAGISYLSRKVIIQRVKKTVDNFKDVANGDLNKRLDDDSQDEIGELSRWFNTFLNNIRNIVLTVQSSVEKSSTASAHLLTTARDLSNGSREQVSMADQVASASTEMSQTIMHVAKNAVEALAAAGKSLEIANNGKTVVEQTVNSMANISRSIETSSKTIESLGESSKQIGDIINVINDIAGQTNLLALNAAIEAARAGEQGRGFAVVADEVRKLAEKTSKATEEITGKIKKIQEETALSVEGMKKNMTEVVSGVKLAERAIESLHGIVEISQQCHEMVQLIATATEEQSAAIEQVSSNMDNIVTVSKNTQNSSSQIDADINELSEISGELKSLVSWFKIGSHAVEMRADKSPGSSQMKNTEPLVFEHSGNGGNHTH